MVFGHRHHETLTLLAAYVAFGVLHELVHLVAASWLLPYSSSPNVGSSAGLGSFALLNAAVRAVLGRYSLVQVSDRDEQAEEAMRKILHSGWIFSLILAVVCHVLHIIVRNKLGKESSFDKKIRFNSMNHLFLNPTLPVAAYITAIEAIVTDLFGFIPIHPCLQDPSRLMCFCGNFGVLLLNPSWLSDGGRTALDVLEKMVNVTMMRGMSPRFVHH